MKTLGSKLGHIRKLQRVIADRLGHPPQESLFDSLAALPPVIQKRRYRRRPLRDPHAPIRPDTYTKFLRQDPQFAKLPFVEIAKLVDTRWSCLPKYEKEAWNKDAATQSDIYKSKLADFNQTKARRGYNSSLALEKVPLSKTSSPAVKNVLEFVSVTQRAGFKFAQNSPTALICGLQREVIGLPRRHVY